jgi:hypothetical protein
MNMPRAKRMTDAESITEGERILAQDQSKFEFERVTGLPNPNPPITIRMTPILVEELDRLAIAQHRKRANLIQHVLWEYVFAQKVPAKDVPKASTAKTATVNAKAPRRRKSTARKTTIN